MTGLYSVNLRVMGGSNVPLSDAVTLVDRVRKAAEGIAGVETVRISLWEVPVGDLAVLAGSFLLVCLLALALHLFLRTDFGTALRASGDNGQMALAQGVSASAMLLVSLMLTGGLVALTGALLAQYQGFADVQMGVGTLVLGLASVIMGQALVRTRSLGGLPDGGGDGVGALPAAGVHRPALGPQPQRPEAHHGVLRPADPGAAGPSGSSAEGQGGASCLTCKVW